ncbi:MAG: 4Fe-4S dicluster domain-containing protein [Acidobacteria bacterium]|nr:4Fe-4S dicluster domain-containing protein [Acidobacteriota bacterium]
MQRGFYIDLTVCMGCYTCTAACKNWNHIPPAATAEPGTQGPRWRRVTTVESGAWPDARIVSVSLSCMHCGKPACIQVCPANAIRKRAGDGIVIVDRDRCIGCHACASACPFGVPQYGEDGTMQKCNYCLDRVEKGQQPACVESCPPKALRAGTMEELSELAAKKAARRLVAASDPSVWIAG